MGYLRLRTTEQLRRGGADRADTAPRLSPLFSCPGEENEWWCVQDLRGEEGAWPPPIPPGERRYLKAGAASLARGPGGARWDTLTASATGNLALYTCSALFR